MESVDVRYIGSEDQYQTYSPTDLSLINTVLINGKYGGLDDYIEYFIKDLNGVVLDSNYYATQYNVGENTDPQTNITSQLFLDPETDVKSAGYNRGTINIKYNFFTKQLLSSPDPNTNFWIKEISTSRTEIKVARQDLSNTQLFGAFNAFNTVLSADPYYPTFYLNFGLDVQIIGVNAVYVEEDGSGYLIFKLYEPLPTEFDLKSTFWVVTQAADPAEFNVTINVTPQTVIDTIPIQGPNYKVSVLDKVGQTTPYYTYASLLTTSVTSSYQQLKSMMQEKGIQINVDYSDFSNFVHFSSATERLYNFVYKVQQIESASLGLTQTNTSTAKVLLQAQIDNTIANFDGYEYYLYFNSASTTWPKQTQTQPYLLYSATSSQVSNWLGSSNITPTATTMSMYWSSSRYDDQNKDFLLHATPSYITEDDANTPYLVFLNMIGQHFDNIWIYLKDVTNHYSAENNPFVGISMDQVANALKSFGVQLYTNTSITDNIYYSLLGINQTGSALPVTSSGYSTVNIASSSLYPLAGQKYLSSSLLLPPFGEEKINRYVITFVTGSGGQAFQTLPASQIRDEVYKRLYHNLPYLLKTRGTERGVKALVTTFGIPGNILAPHEYGGYNIYTTPGIQEINNDKITSASVLTISSSLLSPYATLQYYQDNTDKSSNVVEVGFSPADSINASITSSGYITSSTQPGYFNIMQYIGAPNLQYSSSYTPLVQLSTNYFNNTYTERYNVWDFIRVIKYYNNSLFKMVRDFVPARSTINSGIVIKSHMLERNKYPRHEPTVTFTASDATYDTAFISASDGGSVKTSTAYIQAIPVQYNVSSSALSRSFGTVYVSSSDNVQAYTGEFSGSIIYTDVANFSQLEVSSYLYPWTSSIPGEPSGAVIFTTYSVSPVSENVFTPVRSQRFIDLDYNANQIVPVNYGLVTQSLSQSLVIGFISQSCQEYSQFAYIQDYNYSFRPTIIPRYSGSYLSGCYYNIYTTRSMTYAGDESYGNEPVINYYTDKLGLFTQVATSSFIPGAVNATLAYLADVSGGLFELNRSNCRWQDVQNIFKAGTCLTVKQFDNKKYSDQKTTDGIKTIYNSGYSYTPQLYFMSGTDAELYFQYVGGVTSNFVAFNSKNPPNGYISGSTAVDYPVTLTTPATRTGNVYCTFDSANPSTDFCPGTVSTFACYCSTQNGQKTFTINSTINFQFPDPSICLTSGSYTIGVWCNDSSLIGQQRASFTSSYTTASCVPGAICTPGTATKTAGTYCCVGSYGLYTGPFTVNGGACTGDGTSQVCVAIYSWCNPSGPSNGPLVKCISGTSVSGLTSVDGGSCNPSRITSITSATCLPASCCSTATCNISFTTNATNFAPGDTAVFRFTQDGMSSANFTSSIATSATSTANNSLALGTVAIGAGGYAYASTGSTGFISSIANETNQSSLITFNTSISQYYQYIQVPYFVSGGRVYSSSLYDSPVGSGSYGAINNPFYPQFGDKVIISDYNGITQNLDVVSSSLVGGVVQMSVVPQVLSNWETPNTKAIYKVLILKRYNDEQNVILTFNKPPGQTSYGFIIPNTINPNVIANINTLQAAVQAQLLSTQANTPTTNTAP